MSEEWTQRVRDAVGPGGYHPCMRRSLQTVILYEARRSLESRLKTLRPFQRKIAFMEQCFYLLDSLDFIFPNQKVAIFWRTMTSRVQLDSDTAWARLKGINRELVVLSSKVTEFCTPGRSHQEAVSKMVEEQFIQSESKTKTEVPVHWEHAHNHVIMTFRIYYDGPNLDPDIPEVKLKSDMEIPQERPRKEGVYQPKGATNVTIQPRPTTNPSPAEEANCDGAAVGEVPVKEESTVPSAAASTTSSKDELERTDNERRQLLKEVRDHLELLKEFEGIIPDEELTRRKRELFRAMPPAPTKRLRTAAV